MAELPMKKRLLVLRFYLEGYAYSEISARAGVAKGSITSIVNDLKAGRLPAPADLGEQVEELREVTVELRRSRLSGAQAAAGLVLMRRVLSLGIEPGDLDRFVSLCQNLAEQGEGVALEAFVQAALEVDRLCEETGLDFAGLVAKIQDLSEKRQHLEEQIGHLEPTARQAERLRNEIKELESERKAHLGTNAGIQRNQEVLRQQETKLVRREEELATRVQDLEERAQLLTSGWPSHAETSWPWLSWEFHRRISLGWPRGSTPWRRGVRLDQALCGSTYCVY